MIPASVLISVFFLARLTIHRAAPSHVPAARLALAAMLLMTGASHFTKTAELAAMLPDWAPGPGLVYATGVLELAIAVMLVVRPSRVLGVALALMLLALLPANVYSALANTGYGAKGASYLVFRIPLQLFFIAWALGACGVVPWKKRAASTQASHRAVAGDVRGAGPGRQGEVA